MAERDPFGRLPDENPLAGLGTLSDGTASEPEAYVAPPTTASSEASFSAAPPRSKERVADAKPESKPPPKPPSASTSAAPSVDASLAEVIRQAQQLGGVDVTKSMRTVGRVVKLAVFLVVVAIIVSVGSSIFDASKSLRDTVGDIPSPKAIVDDVTPEPSEPEQEAVPAVGLSASSMLTRRNFSRAMARLRTSGLGRMRTMSVRPERIDAQLLTKGGSLRSVQIAAADPTEIRDFGAGSPGFSHLETIPFARINPAAPSRLARSAAGRARKPLSQVDYVVLISFSGAPTWSGFMKDGKHYIANSRGRITRSLN